MIQDWPGIKIGNSFLFVVPGKWVKYQLLRNGFRNDTRQKKSVAYKDIIIQMNIILFTRQNTLAFWEPLSFLCHYHIVISLVDFRLNYASVPYLMLHSYYVEQPHSAAIIESTHLEDIHNDFCLVQECWMLNLLKRQFPLPLRLVRGEGAEL